VVDEEVFEVDEVDSPVPTVPPILPRLRIQLPMAGLLKSRKLLPDRMDKKAKKLNLQLKLPPLERGTISLLLEDGEMHLLQRNSRRLPSLEMRDGLEKESRQCRRSIRQLLLP
jgi:hypothetical protein